MNTYAILWPCLQQELLEKEAVHASVLDQLRRFQGRVDQLGGVEAANTALQFELEVAAAFAGTVAQTSASSTELVWSFQKEKQWAAEDKETKHSFPVGVRRQPPVRQAT